MLPDFPIDGRFEGQEILTGLGLNDFHSVCAYVNDLPYGRNTSRADFLQVLTEKKGTCSSKHGLLARLAEAHGRSDIHLMVGIFLMSAETHPALGPVLQRFELEAIPEAHAYLRFQDKRYDFTARNSSISAIEPFIVREQRCESQQLIDWKPMIHKHYIEGWTKRQRISYTPEEIWEIREKCIERLAGQ